MIWVGVVIIILAFYLIMKKYEARMILFLAGLIMVLLSGHFLTAIDKISAGLVGFIPQVIAAACAYAYLMNYTKCDIQLATWLMRYVKKAKSLIIPGSLLVSAIVAYAINSPAGLAAAIGPVVIPVMIKAGVHPVVSAACLLFSSWANVVAFGSQPALVAQNAGVTVPQVIVSLFPTTIIAMVIGGIVLIVLAKAQKQDKGYVAAEGEFTETEEEMKVNYLHAILPFLPVIMIFISIFTAIPDISVQQSMYISCIIAIIITRCNAGEAVKAMCRGIGMAFGDVVTIIAAAGVFTLGMTSIGLIDALIKAMSGAGYIAKIAAAVGPFVIAFISGSGDAATIAFNTAVTPHVAEIGLSPLSIGDLAIMSGALGRTMSPVAGVTILCAAFAKVNPLDVARKSAPACIAAIIVSFICLGYLF